MRQKLLQSLTRKSLDIFEENIGGLHCIETEFRHYSELVRIL